MDAQQPESENPNEMPSKDQQRMKSNSVVTEDLETAITKAGFGKFNYIMLLIGIPASCTTAVVSWSMSFVIPVAGVDLGLTPMTKALLQSAPYGGMIMSAFLWGVLSDLFGRKRLVVLGFLLDFAMNTLSGVIKNVNAILVFKFLSGFMVCGPHSIFMAYISELFVEKKRDLAVLSSGMFASVLLILHVCLAFVVIPAKPPDWLPLKSWQLFIILSGLPSLISGTACAFCVESPKFLASKGKSEKALEVCKKIYTINTGRPADTYPVKKIRKPVEFMGSPKKVSVRDKLHEATAAFKPPIINRLTMTFALQIAVGMAGNMIRLWLPELLTVMANADPVIANQSSSLCPLLVAGHQAEAASSEVVSGDDVYYIMILLNACGLACQILFFFLVKYVGKKILIMAVASISLACYISIPNIQSSYIFIPSSIIVPLFSIAYFCQLGLIVEIFPTNVRATSISLNMMVGRMGILFSNFFFANLVYTQCEYTFYILALVCLGIVIICLFLNTKPFEAPSNEKKRLRLETL